MSNSEVTKSMPIAEIFDDPVAYLASFGIEAVLIAGTNLAAAA